MKYKRKILLIDGTEFDIEFGEDFEKKVKSVYMITDDVELTDEQLHDFVTKALANAN